jgi:hypothetical protein
VIIPVARLGPGWTVTSRDDRQTLLHFDDGDGIFAAVVRRPADGPLRTAYPVSAHDVEICPDGAATSTQFGAHLAALTTALLADDPTCRRVVVALATCDDARIAVMPSAGYRHVVDVEVPGAELSLFVREADWLIRMDLDRVPGT